MQQIWRFLKCRFRNVQTIPTIPFGVSCSNIGRGDYKKGLEGEGIRSNIPRFQPRFESSGRDPLCFFNYSFPYTTSSSSRKLLATRNGSSTGELNQRGFKTGKAGGFNKIERYALSIGARTGVQINYAELLRFKIVITIKWRAWSRWFSNRVPPLTF